jgi:16S rRNA (cytidine1402-2'-O)-methyltransferase
MPGTLFVVATPIGNLDDITARALRVLREVAVIAAEDTRRTRGLLVRYGITTATTSLHAHNEESKGAALLARLQRGDDIAIVSDAGTPGVSDPGQRLVQAAHAAGIRVTPVPGPSAVMAALSASGFPSDTFLFLGFPPTRPKDRMLWFKALQLAERTTVFFESPTRVRSTLEEIVQIMGEQQIFVGRELTKVHEESVVQPISAAITSLERAIGEFTIVLDLGHKTENVRPVSPPDAAALRSEFAEIAKNTRITRRQAFARIGRKYGLMPNQVYALFEKTKKSVK